MYKCDNNQYVNNSGRNLMLISMLTINDRRKIVISLLTIVTEI